MLKIRLESNFLRYLIACWLAYGFLALLAYGLKLYEYLPAAGFIGYAIVIGLLLFALNEASKKWHYLVVGANLVLIGAIASFDIIISKQEIAKLLSEQDGFSLTMHDLEGFVQILIILLNIFTGSLAANCLFYGLNKKNFE